MDVAPYIPPFAIVLAAVANTTVTNAALEANVTDGFSCTIAVLINFVTSVMTVYGFVLQKQANDSPARCKVADIVISFKWIVGFIIGIILPIPAQVVAYSMAPMSLLTPLSGVSVALNMIAAPWLLGEELQTWPDIPACLCILLGTLLTTLAGPRHDGNYNFQELMALLGRAAFIVAFIVLMITIISCITYMKRRRTEIERAAKERPTNPRLWDVSLPALVAACCACISNISLKASGELIKGGAEFMDCLVWLLSSGVAALFQLNYVNRGLRLYMQTIFFPIYSALMVVTNTLYGLIFYNEFDYLGQEAGRAVVFFGGIGMIVLGITMFRLRRSKTGPPLLLCPATASDDHLAADTELGSRPGWANRSGCSPVPLRENAVRDAVVGIVDVGGQEVTCTSYVQGAVGEERPTGWTAIVD